MSSNTLRRAAALMRERAQAAEGEYASPWRTVGRTQSVVTSQDGFVVVSEGVDETGGTTTAAAEHIASWHPQVALAVADWLDKYADLYEASRHRNRPVFGDHEHAMAFARIYLGGDQ